MISGIVSFVINGDLESSKTFVKSLKVTLTDNSIILYTLVMYIRSYLAIHGFR